MLADAANYQKLQAEKE